MTRALVVLSAPAPQACPVLEAARARFGAADLTVVLRQSQRDALADLLDGAAVLLDKPAEGRLAFMRALRHVRFEQGVVIWSGSWSYWPSKLAFVLARVRTREVVTERGTFTWSGPAVARHLLWRAKVPAHATAGMPPGVPWPLALPLALVRATLGRVLGPLLTAIRALARTSGAT